MKQRSAFTRRTVRTAGLGGLLVLSSLAIPMASPASAATHAVTPGSLAPWTNVSYRYTNDNCTAFASPDTDTTPDQSFVAGPATPPSGTGSLKFVIDAAGEQQLFRTAEFNDTLIDDIDELSYSTYVETAGKQPPYFRLTVDTDGDGTYSEADGDQSLFFYPVNNSPITTAAWQTWDLDQGTWNINGDGGPTTTLAAYALAHPDAAIVDSFEAGTADPNEAGGVTVAQGCADGPSTTYADEIIIDTADREINKYDLEATAPARTLTIDPKSGPAGTKITVTGTDCFESSATAVMGQSRGESGDELAKSAPVTPAANGTFTATITVPAGADPDATQSVFAVCGTEAQPAFSYGFQSFDVTGRSFPTGTNGYRMVAADGGIFTFGARTFHGSTGDIVLNKPIVGGATDKGTYDGYWIVASDGGVFTFNAPFFGSLGDQKLNAPATEIEPTPTGKGYWIVLADGKVYTFGDANHFGDMAGKALNKPIIGMSVTPSGKGYWLVAEDGGIFNFGDAGFFGSTGNLKLNAPVIDLAPAVDNNGYYLLARDGGVFTFGTADFKGSTGDMKLNAPVIDLAPTADNQGYFLVAKDGGVFTFGSAEFKGSTGDMKLNAPVIAMLVSPNGAGYWLAATDGGIFTFGAVEFLGSMGGTKLNSPVLDLIN